MAQTLESVNAYSSAQSEINFQHINKKRKPGKFLRNEVFNLLVRQLFQGATPVALAAIYGVSEKTVYQWRRLIMLNQPIPRFFLEEETKKVISQSQLKYRVDGRLIDWKPTEKEITMEQNNPQDACVEINYLVGQRTSHLHEAVNQMPKEISGHEFLLVAPSGSRLLTSANDATLMLYLKAEGFEIYEVSLSKI